MSSTKEQAVPDVTRETSGDASPRQVIGRFLDSSSERQTPVPDTRGRNGRVEIRPARPPLAVFCHEPPDSFVGGHVSKVVSALAAREQMVHLFCRHSFRFDHPLIRVHAVGNVEGNVDGNQLDLIEQVQRFARDASNAFLQVMPVSQPVAVLGYEWTSAPVLSLLKGLRNLPTVLSLHSLERQRSDLSSEISRKIVEIEYEGIQSAAKLLLHDPATIEVARQWIPSCMDRLIQSRPIFPTNQFEHDIDPGTIKSRYQVGPIDPMILYVGDLDERYGPDVLLRAMPALLRHHPQVRLVIVGDGNLFWPLRVYTRYLLLEHAVRLVGHVEGQDLHTLIQASDVVAVPSREPTPWWPIQAAWAARKPVVATHDAARGLTEHEKDSVLIYPSENSVVWGVERVLYDQELRVSIGEAGRRKLEDRFGWNSLAEQLESILATQTVSVG